MKNFHQKNAIIKPVCSIQNELDGGIIQKARRPLEDCCKDPATMLGSETSVLTEQYLLLENIQKVESMTFTGWGWYADKKLKAGYGGSHL